VLCRLAAPLGHGPVAVDPLADLGGVFRRVIQGDADEPGMQIRLRDQNADPLFLAAVQFLQARDFATCTAA
jgi:hypothetical protein